MTDAGGRRVGSTWSRGVRKADRPCACRGQAAEAWGGGAGFSEGVCEAGFSRGGRGERQGLARGCVRQGLARGGRGVRQGLARGRGMRRRYGGGGGGQAVRHKHRGSQFSGQAMGRVAVWRAEGAEARAWVGQSGTSTVQLPCSLDSVLRSCPAPCYCPAPWILFWFPCCCSCLEVCSVRSDWPTTACYCLLLPCLEVCSVRSDWPVILVITGTVYYYHMNE